MIEAEEDNSEEMVERFEKVQTKMKYKALGKTKAKTKRHEEKEMKEADSAKFRPNSS